MDVKFGLEMDHNMTIVRDFGFICYRKGELVKNMQKYHFCNYQFMIFSSFWIQLETRKFPGFGG